MSSRIDNFIIRQPDGSVRFANSLVLGRGLAVAETAGGLPELNGVAGEAWLVPSGGDDTARMRAALDTPGVARVRLAPGQFNVTGPITLAAGQVLVGSGADTEIVATHNGTVVILGSANSGVESLTLRSTNSAQLGVQGNGANLWVEQLRVTGIGNGISLSGSRLVVQRTQVDGADQVAALFENATDVAVRDVVFSGTPDGLTLWAKTVDDFRVSGARLENGEASFNDGSAHFLSNITFVNSTGMGANGVDGFTMVTVRGDGSVVFIANCTDVSLTGVTLANAYFTLSNVNGVSMASCSAQNASSLLLMQNCHNAVIGSFLANQSGTGVYNYVIVGGGSTLVFFSSIRRIGASTGTYELDVSGAGGRVLFAQHNFNPAKVNSGGKFVAL